MTGLLGVLWRPLGWLLGLLGFGHRGPAPRWQPPVDDAGHHLWQVVEERRMLRGERTPVAGERLSPPRRGGRRPARRGGVRRLLVPAGLLAALVGASAAVAFWTASGSGGAAAAAGVLNPPTGVTVPTTNTTGTVHVSWTASSPSGGGVTPDGYYVERNDGTLSWSLACGSSPSSLVTGTNCDDTGLSSGDYTYRATAVYSSWATQSDPSGSVTVTITVDNTPPDVHVTKVNGSPVTFPYSTNGTITSIGGTCGTAPGDLTPVDWSIGTPTQSGTATCSGGGDWSSGTLATTISAEGDYTATASQDDSAANHGSDSVLITIDTTAPLVAVTKVNTVTQTFPYSTNVDVTSIGGTCGTLTGDDASVSWSFSTQSGTASCTTGTWTSGTFATAISAEATYTAHVDQGDAAGNSGSDDKSVTIDKTAPTVVVSQAGTQADPTKNLPIHFTAVFNEPVNTFTGSNVTVSGTAGHGSATVTVTQTDSTHYDLAVAGLTSDGTVSASVNAAATTDLAGNSNTASTDGADNTVTYDTTAPTATITFPVSGTTYKASTFNAGCSPTGLCGTASDATGVQAVTVSIKRNADGLYWNGSIFSGSSQTFNAVTTLGTPGGTSTTWKYTFALPASDGGYTVHVQTADTLGNALSGTNYADTATFTIDTTAPTVSSINRDGVDPNPAKAGPLHFTVTFSEPVSGVVAGNFTAANTNIGGTAPTIGTVAPVGSAPTATWTVAVSTTGATGANSGSTIGVNLSSVGSIQDAATNALAGTHTSDQLYTYDTTAPTATIALQAGSDTGSSSSDNITKALNLVFDVTFSESVSGLSAGSFSKGAGTATGCSFGSLTGSGSSYTITASGCSEGTLTVRLAANAVSDTAGNQDVQTDGSSVTIDRTAPTVVVSQAGTQADPTKNLPIHFTAVFNEPVNTFTGSNVTVSGTAGHGSATVTVTQTDSTHYDLAVAGLTSDGTVSASVNAAATTDLAGNNNAVSTNGTDNTVTYDTTAPTSTLVFPAAGPYNAAGWTAGCNVSPFSVTDKICGTATDPGATASGVNAVTVSIQSTSGATSGKYWGGSSFNSTPENKIAAATSDGYAHWTLAFPAANFVDGTYTVRVYSTDAAGNPQTATTSQSFTISTLNTTTTTVGAPLKDATNQTIPASAITSALSGGTTSPTVGGTITFSVYGPSASFPTTCQTTTGGSWTQVGTAAVSGNGTYQSSATFTPTSAGTYWWYASYGGDLNNGASTSLCNSSGMTSTVVSAGTTVSKTTANTYTLTIPANTTLVQWTTAGAGGGKGQNGTWAQLAESCKARSPSPTAAA